MEASDEKLAMATVCEWVLESLSDMLLEISSEIK